MTSARERADDGPFGRPSSEPDPVDAGSAISAADAIDEVARILDRHLEAWPTEAAKLTSWTGRRRQEFDADVAVFLADAVHHPATLKTLAASLRAWAEAP
jgi:hypothetical protein